MTAPVADEGSPLIPVGSSNVKVESNLGSGSDRDLSVDPLNERFAVNSGVVQALLDTSLTALILVDGDGRCRFINGRGRSLLGLEEQPIDGLDLDALLRGATPSSRAWLGSDGPLVRAWNDRHVIEHPKLSVFRADGSRLDVQVRGEPIEEQGHAHGALVTVADISDRGWAEAELRQSRLLQRVAGDIAKVGGWSLDLTTHRFQWTEQLFEILEYPPAVVPTPDQLLPSLSPADQRRVQDAVAVCIAEGTPFDLELQVTTQRGRAIWVRVTGRPQINHGIVEYVIGALQDITEAKLAAQQVQSLAERLVTTLESTTDAFFTLDEQWRFTFLNGRAEQLLQRPGDELLNRCIWEAFPAVVGTELEAAYRQAAEQGTSTTVDAFYYPPFDGWYDLNVYASAQGISVYFRDVTEQERARLVLARHEQQLVEQAALLDKATDAIVVCDLDRRVTYWNAGAERLYGWTSQEVMGQKLPTHLIGDLAAFETALSATIDQGEWQGSLTQATRDGRQLEVAARWTLLRDVADAPRAVLTIHTDMTEQRQLEREFHRAQRLHAIGNLASGVAHDLNNVLTPILLLAQQQSREQEDPGAADIYATIAASASRGADMIRQMLAFARGAEGPRNHVQIDQVLDEVVKVARETFPRNIRVEHLSQPHVPNVVGDATQLQQVLMNLAINARDALTDGGTLRFELTRPDVAGDDDATADTVIIRVHDDGVGMEPELLQQVFKPFFSTKPPERGTGLGLPAARRIARSHGGHLTLWSEVGVGTTATLQLPAGTSEISEPELGAEMAPSRGVGQLILVVDDEDAARLATRSALEAFGYEVVEATDGQEALAVYLEHQDRVSLVLTDVMMPNQDGPRTIKTLRAVTPSLPIVATSGLNFSETALDDTHRVDFLPKPYGIDELLHAVAASLPRSENTAGGASARR